MDVLFARYDTCQDPGFVLYWKGIMHCDSLPGSCVHSSRSSWYKLEMGKWGGCVVLGRAIFLKKLSRMGLRCLRRCSSSGAYDLCVFGFCLSAPRTLLPACSGIVPLLG